LKTLKLATRLDLFRPIDGTPILEYFLSLKYPISIYPEEEGGYTALIPDLPGCMSQGKTLEEGIINIEEASEFG
jgi:antitoxin HicB